MILKLQQQCGAWVYFDDFTDISCRYVSEGEEIGVRADVFDFTAPPPENRLAASGTVKGSDTRRDIWLSNEKGKREILTDGVAYLLNNDGKTIERL